MEDDRRLPYVTEDVPGIGGVIRVTPEDFVVEERPLYQPCGEGEHLYVRITKRGFATPHLVSYLSSRLGIKARAIGVAGLKDANAVTTQIVSLQGVSQEKAAQVKHEKILTLEVLGRHRNRLRPGHHAGNSFRIVVRHIRPSTSQSADQILELVRRRGMPNYFGPQRQGRSAANFRVGAEVLRDQLRQQRMPKHQRVWFINAYQAHLFNRVLARRIAHVDRVLVGDWAMKHANGACFHVEDAEVEQPRADAFEISPTGPLFGSRSPWATGTPGELEREAVASLGETVESIVEAAAACRIRGERRALRVQVRDLDWTLGQDTLTISFSLPPGAYATSLLRELMKTDQPVSENRNL